MNCPHCKKPINVASLLGSMGKGKPKNYSKAEIERRKKRLAEGRKKREVTE